MIQNSLTFDDVLLVPKYSDISSRTEVDISNLLEPDIKLELPIISSPMDTVSEVDMSVAMANSGGLSILHRRCSIEQQIEMVLKLKEIQPNNPIAAAVGTTGDFFERTQELINNGVSIICIDTAHGHHNNVGEALEKINNLPNRTMLHIMAGNVATGEGYYYLASRGANSVRVGVGGGAICSTRINTGFGVPNLSAIFDCVNKRKEIKWENSEAYTPSIIIDGGIKHPGDIVKSLAAGADFIMCGSLLAGTDETPGEIITSLDGIKTKVYRGMASKAVMKDWNKTAAPEGISTTIAYKGPVGPILQDLAGNIRSGFSYAGARNLKELQQNAHFIQQTQAGQQESFTHILHRRGL